MTIAKYLKKDYPRILIDAPVEQVYQGLKYGSCLIVEDHKGEVLGTISSADICMARRAHVNDFLISKPSLSADEELEDALASMAIFGTDCLPVYQETVFIGVILQYSIVLALVNKINADKKVYRDVIHDLRTSIHNIRGLNTLLAENVIKRENVELLELSSSVAEHSLAILQDLLLEGAAGLMTGMERLEVPAFVLQCAEEMKGRAYSKGIDIVYEIPQARFPFLFYPIKFKRAVQNLLSNSIKFTNSGGTISISVGVSEIECSIEIRDTGIGIPVDQQPYVLEIGASAFQDGTDGEHSTGLGLPYVKSCIKQMNGILEVSSTEGKGTTFKIILPSQAS